MPPDLGRRTCRPALTTTSARISRSLASVLDGHARDAATFRADRRRPASAAGSGRPGRAPRPPARWPARTGRASRRSAARQRPEHAVGRHQREAVLRLLGLISSSGSPNVLAQPAWRLELLEPFRASTPGGATRPRATTGRRPSRPPAAGRASVPYIIIFVSVTEPPQLADEARRVEGRARGQLGAVDEDDVASSRARSGGRRSTSRRRRRR